MTLVSLTPSSAVSREALADLARVLVRNGVVWGSPALLDSLTLVAAGGYLSVPARWNRARRARLADCARFTRRELTRVASWHDLAALAA